MRAPALFVAALAALIIAIGFIGWIADREDSRNAAYQVCAKKGRLAHQVDDQWVCIAPPPGAVPLGDGR